MTRVATPARPVTPMTILAARLAMLCERAAELPQDLRAELVSLTTLAAGLDPYLAACSTSESPALRALTARTEAADWTGTGVEQEMLSGHLEGQFLKMLIYLTGASRVLEVGMFTGYSALAMAEALPDNGTVIACELDAQVASFAQVSFNASVHGHKIDVRVGPAAETLAALTDPFDVIFVDADKAGYAGYLDAILDRGLLTRQGVICVDNTLMQGQPWTGERTVNGAAIAAFNQRVIDDPRVEQVLLPLRDGVTLIRRVTA